MRRSAILVSALVTVTAGASSATGDGDPTLDAEPDLLSGLVTEEVEPGVFRVLPDGYRELSPPIEGYAFDGVGKGWGWLARSHEYRAIVAADDGSVWFFEPDRFFRIGRQREWRWRSQPELRRDDFGVAADGTVWRATERTADPVRSFDGQRWMRHRTQKVDPDRRVEMIRGIEIEPDGAVWTTWWRAVGADSIVFDKFARWNGRRWKALDPPRVRGSFGNQFAVSGNDEVWLCCKEKAWALQQRLLRYDGRGWQVIEDPAPQTERIDAPLLIDGVDDGTLWMRRSSSTLARHDDEGWAVFVASEGDPIMGWTQETGGFLRGSPDGSAWVTVSTGRSSGDFDCDGLARFDGEAWTRHLRGACIFAIDIAPDGTAWLQAARMDPDDEQGLPPEPVQTHAIVPDPVVTPNPEA